MSYASIGFIAMVIHIIINYDVLIKSSHVKSLPVLKYYRLFLHSVMIYYFIDAAWGIIYSLKIVPVAYIVTALYFFIMAFSVFLWTRYVVTYLEEKNKFQKILIFSGWFFIIFEVIALIINLFIPVAFWFDEEGGYHPKTLRYLNLGIQTFMFFMTAVYMLIVTARSKESAQHRHRTIGISSLAMMVFVVGQAQHPLLPLYSIGCMITTCLLHTFVLEDEKEERHREMDKLREIELEQAKKLGSALHMAYTDPLTGVKNKHAYFEAEHHANQLIQDGSLKEFGIIVFDLNGLKIVNDTQGHEAGDQYIRNACMMICSQFKHSPIYRIGGDEFVAILKGEDYEHHTELLNEFEFNIEKNLHNGKVVVSYGFDSFLPDEDSAVLSVFERADKKMYECKRKLKEMKL